MRLLDLSQYFAEQLEELMFGGYTKKIKIKLFTDSKPLLELISSTHQIEERLLRSSIKDMKDRLADGSITSFSWLDGERDMMADVLTK